MANVKTAVSLQKPLFDQVENLSQEMNVSRSRLFALALEEFIRRHDNRRLLQEIDDAYQDEPDPEEEARLVQARRSHRRVVEGEW